MSVLLQSEGWPSGLRRSPGKAVYGKPYHEFESRSFREARDTTVGLKQINQIAYYSMHRSATAIGAFVLMAVATLAVYWWLIHSTYFITFSAWVGQYEGLFFLSLLVTKIVGVVWPPIPGGLLTLGSIPILGWQMAYAADLLGSLIGSAIAYHIGKKYGIRLLLSFLDEKTIAKIMKIKVKPNREIESVFMLRLFGGATITEIVCYAAGVLRIRWWQFFIGTLASHLAIGMPLYYSTASLFDQKHIAISIILVVFAVSFFIMFKNRYLEE